MSSPEGLGFVSLYKAFLSPLQYLFSSLLLIRVENFLSTALVWLNLHNTGEKYTGDKITFFSIYVENYIQYSCLKRITVWCGQHSALSLKRRQSAILFYFLKKLDVVGKTIRAFMLWNSPGGENHYLCILLRYLWELTVLCCTKSSPWPAILPPASIILMGGRRLIRWNKMNFVK